MITLTVIFAALVAIAWIFSVYASWRASEGTASAPVTAAVALRPLEKGVRLARRGWYLTLMAIDQLGSWLNVKASTAFVRFFPKSAPIFVKRDKLTGLTHGPSSFFLKTISARSDSIDLHHLSRIKKRV